jgi:site-specific recombinase XerD
MSTEPIPDYPPLAGFLADLTARSRPATTISARRLDLSHLIRWYEADRARPFRLADLAASDIERWMVAGGVAASTGNRRKASLRAWAAWAIRQQIMRDDPSQDIQDARLPQREAKSVSPEAIDAMLREARKDPDLHLARRNEAMLDLLTFGGMRVAELTALILDDVNLSARSVFIRCGKGGKSRYIYLDSSSVAVITRYLTEARFTDGVPAAGSRDSQQRLWFHRIGAHERPGITTRAVQMMVQEIAAQAAQLARDDAGRARRQDEREALLFLAEELKIVTPHTFRHSLARRMVEDGVDLPGVAKALGHAHISTTMIYTVPAEGSLRTAFQTGGARVRGRAPNKP